MQARCLFSERATALYHTALHLPWRKSVNLLCDYNKFARVVKLAKDAHVMLAV